MYHTSSQKFTQPWINRDTSRLTRLKRRWQWRARRLNGQKRLGEIQSPKKKKLKMPAETDTTTTSMTSLPKTAQIPRDIGTLSNQRKRTTLEWHHLKRTD